MGASAAQTVTEIRDVRDRLSEEVAALEQRIDPGSLKRTAVKVGIGLALAMWTLLKLSERRRKRLLVEALASVAR